MQINDLIKYIENPGKLNDKTIVDLTLLADQYPYFQAAQLLRVKNLHNLAPTKIKPVLNFTAAYVTDRKVLYYLLHSIPGSIADEYTETSVLKEKSESLQVNIAGALKEQDEYLRTTDENEIEFTTAINIKKEYGTGDEVEDYVVRITEEGPELIEFIGRGRIHKEEKQGITTEKSNVDKAEEQLEEIQTASFDILEMINKNQSVDDYLENPEVSNNENPNKQLIDNFIKTNPKIRPVDEHIVDNDISENSVQENEHFITDTLAGIYMKQGNYTKAIFAYEKLSLKYPEKSAYFAAQIEEIKKLIENKNN